MSLGAGYGLKRNFSETSSVVAFRINFWIQ